MSKGSVRQRGQQGKGLEGTALSPQIKDLNRIFSINFCFFIDPVTNDSVLNVAIFSVMMQPFSSEYIIFFNPTVCNFLIQSLHGVLLA